MTLVIDVDFLIAAKNIAQNSIYSLHKSSCRNGLSRKVKKIGLEGEGSVAKSDFSRNFQDIVIDEFPTHAKVVAEMKFDLPKTYNFQKKKSKNIEVDLWRFEV